MCRISNLAKGLILTPYNKQFSHTQRFSMNFQSKIHLDEKKLDRKRASQNLSKQKIKNKSKKSKQIRRIFRAKIDLADINSLYVEAYF